MILCLKNKSILLAGCAIFLLTLTQCSNAGGTEAGNPSAKIVIGQMSSQSSQLTTLKTAVTTTCPADTIIATDSSAQQIEAQAESDCSFELELEKNTAYQIDFFLNDSFVAPLIVNNGGNLLATRIVYLDDSDNSIDLGVINFANGDAIPEFEPSEQCDRDGDGIFDFDDTDDDNDDQDDDVEDDCDLDGYEDDNDDDTSECSTQSSQVNVARITEVSPRNTESHVSIDEEIDAHMSCLINSATVNNTTFSVTSSSQNISCEFDISEDEVSCSPQENYTPLTRYTVTIDGVFCSDGTRIPATQWTFTTEDDE